MKSASAMKYGGELVDAVDCDYDSFKELIPLCPNCKEPVFLRSGGQRESAKGKAYQIGPHWCHFKGISAEQVAGCELRVNGYTEKDRAKIANQARGQRLKLLQRWFWKSFISKFHFGYEESLALSKELALDAQECVEMKLCQSLIEHLERVAKRPPSRCKTRNIFNADLNTELSQFIADAASQAANSTKWSSFPWLWIKGAPCTVDLSEYEINLSPDSSIAEARNQIKMVEEIFLFLLSKANRYTLLLPIVFDSVKHFGFDYANTHTKGSDFLVTSEIADMAICSATANLVAFLLSIPWASEFQRLELEAKQRKGAA